MELHGATTGGTTAGTIDGTTAGTIGGITVKVALNCLLYSLFVPVYEKVPAVEVLIIELFQVTGILIFSLFIFVDNSEGSV